jgi:hypothetical protein
VRECGSDQFVEEPMLKAIDEKLHRSWIRVGALSKLKKILTSCGSQPPPVGVWTSEDVAEVINLTRTRCALARVCRWVVPVDLSPNRKRLAQKLHQEGVAFGLEGTDGLCVAVSLYLRKGNMGQLMFLPNILQELALPPSDANFSALITGNELIVNYPMTASP